MNYCVVNLSVKERAHNIFNLRLTRFGIQNTGDYKFLESPAEAREREA